MAEPPAIDDKDRCVAVRAFGSRLPDQMISVTLPCWSLKRPSKWRTGFTSDEASQPRSSLTAMVSSRFSSPELAASDASIRHELVRQLTKRSGTVIHEFSLPTDRLRADLVHVERRRLIGFEIKSAVDRLDRLERQVLAYQQVFSLCTAVVAPQHLRPAAEMVPRWWGLVTVRRDGTALRTVRRPRAHDMVRPEALVSLLWRGEAARLAHNLGVEVPVSAPRHILWAALLREVRPESLEELVADTLLCRNPKDARIPARWAGTR
jgi:hypothetical protein